MPDSDSRIVRDGDHRSWIRENVASLTPVYNGESPRPMDGCHLCESAGEGFCGYHTSAIFYCPRCGAFAVHRADFVPPEEPGGRPISKPCRCTSIDDPEITGVTEMLYLGYEATTDPRIKARTPGVRNPLKRAITTCEFCAPEDGSEKNEGTAIIQLRVDTGSGAEIFPVCDECQKCHGWGEDDVVQLS